MCSVNTFLINVDAEVHGEVGGTRMIVKGRETWSGGSKRRLEEARSQIGTLGVTFIQFPLHFLNIERNRKCGIM